MLTFSQFRLLSEGGNVKINGIGAHPIHITSQNRQQVAGDIHHALSDLHDSFHSTTGHHLFGHGKLALHSKAIFAGSTKHLFDPNIPDEEFAHHKPFMGDVDVFVHPTHSEALGAHFGTHPRVGYYTALGVKMNGKNMASILAHQHPEKNVQLDLIAVPHRGYTPEEGHQFAHSSAWDDIKVGIKGAHHKALLNAAGGDRYKFSIDKGLMDRTDPTDPGTFDQTEMTRKLFGLNANPNHIKSFIGVSELMRNHLHPEEQQKAYKKFVSQISRAKIDHTNAFRHLHNTLNVGYRSHK